jgi:hypothetical protein
MYNVGNHIQIINHADTPCNGQYGTITEIQMAYNGSVYYQVELDDSLELCLCTTDEIMEG